ncbi:hypothetical protein [Microvirga mediterraneensis]|uniref:Uncharacterized protein n=1 Tax=Microvirga mediterraneensis TaxID=2754695 RepID=A0A838BRY1_9HYPH|nr:hypothetical protein [Microvirga mediterraneensis]MBA1157809.1 hypothetical protein [Microvirga mediterraneensis]
MGQEPVTEERLERALAYAAWVVARHGAVYVPLFDRLERELTAYRSQHSSIEERVKRLLSPQTRDGAVKAIR